MADVLIKACAFILMILLGFILKKRHVFGPEAFGVVSKIVLNITLPCAVVTNFNGFFMEYTMLGIVVIGAVLNLLMMGLGFLAAPKKNREERAFNMLNYSGYNIGCFTTPFVQSFLGPVGVVTTCLFDAGNSLLSTGGTYSLAASYLGKGRTNAGAFFKKIFSSVPFVTYLVMLALSILHLSVPAPVTVFTGTVGAANSFLAMLMIGLGLEWNMPKGKGIRIGKALLVRYSAAAILALLLFFCTPFSLEVRQVLALVAMSPIASLAVVFTEKCDGDIAMASTINSLSIMISVLIMTGMILAMGV